MLKLVNVSKVEKYKKEILLIDDEIFEIEPYNENIFKSLLALLEGCYKEDLVRIFGNDLEAEELLVLLSENGMLGDSGYNVYKETFLEKQWYYLEGLGYNPEFLQEKISSATIAIVGVGGVGSVVINSLIRSGVKSLILIDFDNINRSNLNRQILFTEKEVGKSKLDCTKKKILDINPDAIVQTVTARIDSLSSLYVLLNKKIDILINAADTPAGLENIIHEFGYKTGIPTISCGVGRNYGTWGPLFVPGRTICYKCFSKMEEDAMSEVEKYVSKLENDPMVVAFGPINTVVSELMAKDVLLYLALGCDKEKIASLNARCGINFKSLEISRSEYDKINCECWRDKYEYIL